MKRGPSTILLARPLDHDRAEPLIVVDPDNANRVYAVAQGAGYLARPAPALADRGRRPNQE